MSWDNLRDDIAAMFSRLVVFMPEAGALRIDTPELKADVVERVRSWKRRNAKRSKAYDAARYQASREERLKSAREYYAANRDDIIARRKAS